MEECPFQELGLNPFRAAPLALASSGFVSGSFLQLDLSESDFWQSLLFTPKRQGPSESSPFQELSKTILTYLLSNLRSSPGG